MNQIHTKPPVLINIPDLIVQIGLIVWALCVPPVRGLQIIMFLGGGWQLLSHFIHYSSNFSYAPNTLRRWHFVCSMATLGVLAFGAFLWAVESNQLMYVGVLCLCLGAILYVAYMFICLREWVKGMREEMPVISRSDK